LAGGLQIGEGFEQAQVFSLQASLIAVEETERTVRAGQGLEGDGETVGVGNVLVFFIDPGGLVVHFLLEQGGFDGGVAGQPPVGGGDLMHEVGFGFALRAEMVEVGAEVGLVIGFGLGVEDDGAGGESVGERVAGGGELALGGFRAVGLGAVGAGGSDFGW